MKKLLSLFIIFTFLSSNVFALELDTSIDDEIRRNYNPDKLNQDVGLPALPKILNENTVYVEPKPSALVQPSLPSLKKANNIAAKNLVHKVVKTSPSPKKQMGVQSTYITLKKGTKIKVRLQSAISDRTKRGTKVSLISLYPVSTTYFTIPMGTVFKGEVVDSHRPQLSANGGLLKVRINSVLLNGQVQPIEGKIIKVSNKKIFFNVVKGKRKYVSSAINSTRPGRGFFKKMMHLSSNLLQDGSSAIVAPFSFVFGVVALGGNVVASPVLALFYKGGGIYIPENSLLEIKLIQDVFIYK